MFKTLWAIACDGFNGGSVAFWGCVLRQGCAEVVYGGFSKSVHVYSNTENVAASGDGSSQEAPTRAPELFVFVVALLSREENTVRISLECLSRRNGAKLYRGPKSMTQC